MGADVDKFARLASLEMGRLINEARGEVKFSADIWRTTPRTASASWRLLEELHPAIGEAHMESSPIGLIFCVEPWNFPSISLHESQALT